MGKTKEVSRQLAITKISAQKQPSCEKHAALKSLEFISINIIAAICWLPSLIFSTFSPRLSKLHFFHSLAVFVPIHNYILCAFIWTAIHLFIMQHCSDYWMEAVL